MRSRLILIATGALAPVFVSTTAAQEYRPEPPPVFREGEPAVLAPPPRSTTTTADARRANFRRAYEQARSPRMMIFWNRVYTDRSTSDYIDRTTVQTSVTKSYNNGAVTKNGSAEIISGRELVSPTRDSGLSPEQDALMEAAFQQQMTGAGARLIDRTVALRTTPSGRGAEASTNMQAVETEAVTARARLIVEIIPLETAQNAAPVFRVRVKDISTAESLVDFTTTAIPPTGRMPLVPGPNGYVRATPPAPTPQGVGSELASQLMGQLATTLR